ncbi:hypothetical protein HNP55_000234 [Paucibacter oligotrophus]|uniref:Tetratricopeptide repeat protein n=1 Tax=Roseateles oligotrophus TaxID=1769250 RepID=A0A840L6E1_9BURK|nr:hypothetical protein [Roseateles oligotrophus]MBB4841739.1 hypothetical protein [Roseateles oligotrophus]
MHCPETSWKQLTLSGNELFERGLHRQAMQTYEDARTVALQHFQAWSTPADAVAAVVVSYLNLSEAQARSGCLAQASVSLCTLHMSLLHARANTELSCCLRNAAQSHLRESHAALLRFQDLHGDCPQVRHWLEQSYVSQAATEPEAGQARILH